MKKRFVQSILFTCVLFFLSSVMAAPSPLPMMKKMAQDMLTVLKRNQQKIKNNPALVRRFVRQIIVPHVNVYSMAGRVVGRRYWLKASSTDQKTFIRLFKQSVIETYASALSAYDRDRILFYPLRGKIGNYASVRSIIVRRNGQQIPMSYSMRYQGGTWKIIDFSVENVSIVNNYRAQYAGTLSGGGLRVLIREMKSRASRT